MKGQITPYSLVIIVIAAFIYITMIPILQPMIDSTAATLNANSTVSTPATILILQLVPIGIFIALIIVILSNAAPQEGRIR